MADRPPCWPCLSSVRDTVFSHVPYHVWILKCLQVPPTEKSQSILCLSRPLLQPVVSAGARSALVGGSFLVTCPLLEGKTKGSASDCSSRDAANVSETRSGLQRGTQVSIKETQGFRSPLAPQWDLFAGTKRTKVMLPALSLSSEP